MAHPEDPRAAARRRALRAAAALTLGLVSVTTSGCETVTNTYCHVFEHTRTCCQRAPGGSWNESTGRCDYAPPPLGPLVPPSEAA